MTNRSNSSSSKKDTKVIMDKYELTTTMMGEGSFCICWKGLEIETQKGVAIKVYKVEKLKKHGDQVLIKFRKQIEVLKSLMTPFRRETVGDPRMWHRLFDFMPPGDVFIQLVDYSKNSKGEPDNDPIDGISYVVTELAQYSLKDYLCDKFDQNQRVSKPKVKAIAKAFIVVAAALHAKGLVHLDLKPENMMYSGRKWKLIDVDGCVRIGQKVSISDTSISFSPVYCAPQWAQFLVGDSNKIEITDGLDVWSVGISIAELVSLEPVLKDKYVKWMKQGKSQKETSFFFMEWLVSINKVPLPEAVEKYDPAFVELLHTKLLVTDASMRKHLAEVIDDPFFQEEANVAGDAAAAAQIDALVHQEEAKTAHRLRLRSNADHSAPPGLLQSSLYKLKVDGDPTKTNAWNKRDMWLANNGNLCYYSILEEKRLVYLDRKALVSGTVTVLKDVAHDHAFQFVTGQNDRDSQTVCFATDTLEEKQKWMHILADVEHACEGKGMTGVKTQAANANYVNGLRQVKHMVKYNKRQEMSGDTDAFEPTFKMSLWKLKQDGDPMVMKHWLLREMWISKNGSLCYFSKKENRNLIYYESNDIQGAAFARVRTDASVLPYTFEIMLEPEDGCEFEPKYFAADSDEDCQAWLTELERATTIGVIRDEPPSPVESKPIEAACFGSDVQLSNASLQA